MIQINHLKFNYLSFLPFLCLSTAMASRRSGREQNETITSRHWRAHLFSIVLRTRPSDGAGTFEGGPFLQQSAWRSSRLSGNLTIWRRLSSVQAAFGSLSLALSLSLSLALCSYIQIRSIFELPRWTQGERTHTRKRSESYEIELNLFSDRSLQLN